MARVAASIEIKMGDLEQLRYLLRSVAVLVNQYDALSNEQLASLPVQFRVGAIELRSAAEKLASDADSAL